MQKERYVVYEVVDTETSEREELQGFLFPEKAIAYGQRHARRSHRPVSIDWQLEEINRDGREILDTDADLYWITESGERVR